MRRTNTIRCFLSDLMLVRRLPKGRQDSKTFAVLLTLKASRQAICCHASFDSLPSTQFLLLDPPACFRCVAGQPLHASGYRFMTRLFAGRVLASATLLSAIPFAPPLWADA